MSEFLQSGIHPDADQLNAFLEHVLPAHEREQILAHLAACPDCRAVVSIALPVGEDFAIPQAEPARKPWFSGWNLLWPVAAALAAILPVAFYLRNNSSRRSDHATQNEIAAFHQPASIAPLSPSPAPVATESQARQIAKAKPGRPFPADKPAPKGVPSDGKIAFDTSIAQASFAARDMANLPLSNRKVATAGAGAAAISGSASSPAAPLATSSNQSTVEVSSATAVPLEPVTNNFTLSALKTLSPLPSGFPTLSTTSIGEVTIALDTRNTLFYSNDNGRAWKTIPSQWKGRAVRVALANDATRARFYGVIGGITAGQAKAAAPQAMDSAAQSSASALNSSVTGAVTDATGAGIPNASVALSNAAKQTIQAAKSDASGHYTISGLPPGTYQIQATAPGFQTLQKPVTILAAQQNVSNLGLQVGSLSETVTVESENNSVERRQSLQKKAAPAAAEGQSPPQFEIITDTGDRWISLDGLRWTHR